jgi:SAM-dependent methyltransferase
VPRTPAGDFDYDTRGGGYGNHRRADPHIADLVRSALGPARTVCNVGAGAGSYEPTDLAVIAVEPSAGMRAQRPPGLGPVIDARAEELPLADGAVDAAMATVTVHQWADPDQGLGELRRVSRGPVVILTFDGDALERFWLNHYVPELVAADRHRYPAVGHILEVLGGRGQVLDVPIPIDCTDGFTEAFYARPEAFLDPGVRAAQSAWVFINDDVVERSLDHLRRDLESGEWDRRFGPWRRQPEFAGSLRLLTAQPTESR